MELIELVRRAQKGEEEAQGALYERMYKRVYYLALRLTGSPEDAEDAAQEAFISAFKALGGLRDPNTFEGWLFQITANKCRNKAARTKAVEELPEGFEENTPDPNEALLPEEALQSEEKRRMILEIIDALPQAQRECVMLFYFSELSVKQIAEELGCSEGTVKSRLNYARQKIREGILEVEERDGIRLHVLIPLGLLLAQDCELTAAQAAALGGAAGAAGAAGGGAAAAGAAKTGLLATVKAKIIAGVTAAAIVVGGAVAIATQLPQPLHFTDPAMEQNIRVMLDKPTGRLTTADVEEVRALYLFDDGMALMEHGGGRQEAAMEGTGPVESLEDLAAFPHLNGLYYTGEDPDLLGTLAEGTPLQTLMCLQRPGGAPVLQDLTFLDRLPKLLQFNAGVVDGTDLAPLARAASLQEIALWSSGSLRLEGDNLTRLLSLRLTADYEGLAPGAACGLALTRDLPELRILSMHGGDLPPLDFLSHMPNLRTLDLYGDNAGALDLAPIGGLDQLRAVMMVGQSGQTMDLAPLAQCGALEVYAIINETYSNPPPQAVMDADGSMPVYNAVNFAVQEEVSRLMGWDD